MAASLRQVHPRSEAAMSSTDGSIVRTHGSFTAWVDLAQESVFAALTVVRIRKVYAALIGSGTPTACIFILDVFIENELVFLEDFLHVVYKQLTRSTSGAVPKAYEKYMRACNSGRRTSIRIELLMQVLRQKVTDICKAGLAFLVVDNIDHCSSSLRELLQRELSILQHEGLSILVTTRLSKLERQEEVWCDFHQKGNLPLTFYCRCMSCEECFICENCRKQGNLCSSCGTDTIWAEPEHFDLSLDSIYEGSIRDFIIWDLEREHGDLGLGSINPRKPPLSSFGMEFLKTKSGIAGREWVEEILRSCNGSIVQVKLALDRIHSSPSLDLITFTPDRIATNVRAIFDTAIEKIFEQTPSQRELALKSIAAIGKTGDRAFGLPLSQLAVLLRERPYTSAMTRIPPRSVEDILDAANGYLRLREPSSDGGEYTVAAFNMLFYIFAFDDYNDELIMANSQLRTSKVPRSFTLMPHKENVEQEEQSWEDILGDLRKFQSPKLSDMSARKSPPIGQGSPSINRSQTFIAPTAPRGTSPPKGLGMSFDIGPS